MKKLLVTGGAGFIGSNFIKYILNKYVDYKIVNLDALTYAGNLENLKDIENHKNYNFLKGNITDIELVNNLFTNERFDYVIHFAAESHVDRSIQNPRIFVETNIMGTQILLDSAKKSWYMENDASGHPLYKEGVKYLQISTDEVYGALGKTGRFTEKTPLAPNSPYAASKASADMMVRAYYETYRFPMNITRCSNNYGPYQFPEKLIPLMILNGVMDKKLPIYGDGRQIRDWLHVTDHCRAIDIILHQGQTGEVYNIGGNNEKTNMEIVKLILKNLRKSEDLIIHVKDRPGHDRRYAMDTTKLTAQLGWQPGYTFDEGMEKTIQWYLDHKQWWKKILTKKSPDV
ncbi:MAG: dTDP-glucose 4,6-dehydratase [Eubacteriales bacterium]